jgi:hypothetical protein
MTWQELRSLVDSATAALRAYRGALRLLRPIALDRDTAVHVEGLTSGNEGLRRLMRSPAEKTRLFSEVRGEAEAARRLAAGVARLNANESRATVAKGREMIAAARRNVLLSLPEALNNVTADGMIALALLELQMEAMLTAANQAKRQAVYEAALQRKDPRAFVEVSIIERLDGNGKPLRELIEGVQELRVPHDLPDLDALERELSTLDSRADLLHVGAIDPEQHQDAADAHAQLLDAMTVAGTASDRDDQAALREELVS